MIIVLGLGNPGEKHSDNRHNVGFMVLDELASKEGVTFEEKKIFHAETCELGDLFLVKPKTFMNQSGTAARLLL